MSGRLRLNRRKRGGRGSLAGPGRTQDFESRLAEPGLETDAEKSEKKVTETKPRSLPEGWN